MPYIKAVLCVIGILSVIASLCQQVLFFAHRFAVGVKDGHSTNVFIPGQYNILIRYLRFTLVEMSNRPNFEVRFLRASEAQRLSELIKSLQDYQQLEGVSATPSKDDVVKDLFHKDDSGDFVPHNLGTFSVVAVDLSKSEVKDHSNIVGYLIYTITFNLMQGHQFYLNSFFIEEPYRRHGLGSKFVKFMQAHGELLGIDKFDVPFMKKNIIGQKFYKTFGAYLVDEEYNLMSTPLDF